MTVHMCAGCSTRYALDLPACPHCGSAEVESEGVVGRRRLPLFAAGVCDGCARQWHVRLSQVQPGLVELPRLFCASCGSQVQLPWPPVEDDMPKITRSGGPSNARADGPSPDVLASEPLAGAEAGQGHSSSDPVLDDVQVETEAEEVAEADEVEAPDYDGMTLAELKAAAEERGVPAYGTKAQIAERLREADQEG